LESKTILLFTLLEHPGRTPFALGGAISYIGTISSHKPQRAFLVTNQMLVATIFVDSSHKIHKHHGVLQGTQKIKPQILWLLGTSYKKLATKLN
jgi:hypothetical protein